MNILDMILIGNWKGAWKLASMWVFLLIAISPELFGIAVQSGFLESDEIPALFARLINLLGLIGMISRVVKQRATEQGLLTGEEPADGSK